MKSIGFGCSKLTSNFTEKQALRNLNTAFDNGITHFDVARMYGFGLAEGIVGKFAKNKRDKITITTKVGISPASTLLKNLFLQNTIRYLYKKAKKLPIPFFSRSTQSLVVRDLEIQSIKKSLEMSLLGLKTDYIDYLLLHEATVLEANNDELLKFLEMQKRKGTICAYGIASYQAGLGSNISSLDKKHTIIQVDNSFPKGLPQTLLNIPMEKKIYFSPFRYFSEINSILSNKPLLARSISEKLGFDVTNSLVDLFLMNQRFAKKSDCFLFASSKNKHIKKTIERWSHVSELPFGRLANFNEIQKTLRDELSKAGK